jgi:uncharacterized membrane protein
MASTAESTLHVRQGHGAPARLASVLGAGTLAYYGFKRRDLTGLGLALIGGALLGRAAAGRDRRARLRKQHGRAAVLDATKAVKVDRSVTVARPADVLFGFWRNFENLPRIMGHLESVTVLSAERSRWKAKGPAGMTVEWEAVIHNEVENELIAWKSTDDADVKNAGSVRFKEAPGGRGTEVRVVLEYEPPAGKLGMVVAKLLGEEPDLQVREDLRRFKQLMETGEIPVSEARSERL